MFEYLNFEKEYLSKFATKSTESKGREFPMEPCGIRTEFQRDRDRILHCKSFRRLKYKTQVFLSPFGDHYRTRLTHTLEVSQIARTIARALRLNEDLVEAISLGHDLGHTPFGHAGEKILDKISGGKFRHNEQSLRIVEKLENGGKGLNLTFEVRDGILNHRTACKPGTIEGKVVQIADKIAYINHDIDDAIRAKIFELSDLPKDCIEVLGKTHGQRIDTMVVDIFKNSYETGDVQMSEEVRSCTYRLRKYLFDELYCDNNLAKQDESKAGEMIERLYEYYFKHPESLPEEEKSTIEIYGKTIAIIDYISGMTDRYAVNKFVELFIPKEWK